MGGKSELRNLFHVNLKCADDSYVSLFATEIPTICAPVYRPDIPLHVLQSFEGRCSNRVRFLLEIYEGRHRKEHRGSSGPRERLWVGSVW